MVKLDNIMQREKKNSLLDYFKVKMQRINKLDVTYGGEGILFIIKLNILHLP